MATFYLDHLGGNDSNDGTTFANRWKTITSGATAARIAPGDTIRIMSSAGPTSIGTCSWTNLSSTVTLEYETTKNIDMCETAWTQSTNITCGTSNTIYREGSNSCTFIAGLSFTTGLMAYKNLGSAQDFSGYQQISFWIRSTFAIAANTLKLSLCSGTNGTTEVNQFIIPAIPSSYTNMWCVFTLDYGGALGNSIQSIGLFALLDPGSLTIYLDCIIACKANSAENSLTLNDLIGKNTDGEPWWAINSINGTTLTLSAGIYSNTNSSTMYVGTTENAPTYKYKTIPIYNLPSELIQDSGTVNKYITYSGGWNTTDMSTQTGITFLDGCGIVNVILGYATSYGIYTYLENLGGVRGQRVSIVTGGSSYLHNIHSICNAFYDNSYNTYNSTFDEIYIIGTNTSWFYYNCTLNNVKLYSSKTYNYMGLSLTYSSNCIFKNMIIKNNGGGLVLEGSRNNKFYNCTFEGNAFSLQFYTSTYPMTNRFINCTFNDSTLLSFYDASVKKKYFNVYLINYNNTEGDDRYYEDGLLITKETGSDRHTLDGVAWKIEANNVASTRNIEYPVLFNICSISTIPNQSTTISCYVKKSQSTTNVQLFIPSYQILSMSSDLYTNYSGNTNEYNLVSINFTPTEYGIIKIYIKCWDNTNTFNVFIDDITITKT